GVRGERYQEGQELRGGEFEAALLMFEARDVLLAAKRARIPLRVGPLSKPGSVFRFTHPVRQSRSRGEKNEAEYNLDLARKLVAHLGGRARGPSAVEIPTEVKAAEEATLSLRGVGVREREAFLVLHPGMGGSAANLSPASYLKMLGDLEARLEVK